MSIKASGNGAEETAKGAVVGGVLGAVAGAAIGAISGNAGSGAAKQGFEMDGSYKKVFKKCM